MEANTLKSVTPGFKLILNTSGLTGPHEENFRSSIMNPLSKLYKIATERPTRPDPLENVAHISTARFSQSWDAHGYHNVLAAAGYPVGRVQRDDRTATLKASWYFQHRHEDGDALAVVSHLIGKHGPVDREWLARQWPEAYRRINAVMSK